VYSTWCFGPILTKFGFSRQVLQVSPVSNSTTIRPFGGSVDSSVNDRPASNDDFYTCNVATLRVTEHWGGGAFDLRHQPGGNVFDLTTVSVDIVLYVASVVGGRNTS
jgi:hypothetical protein